LQDNLFLICKKLKESYVQNLRFYTYLKVQTLTSYLSVQKYQVKNALHKAYLVLFFMFDKFNYLRYLLKLYKLIRYLNSEIV